MEREGFVLARLNIKRFGVYDFSWVHFRTIILLLCQVLIIFYRYGRLIKISLFCNYSRSSIIVEINNLARAFLRRLHFDIFSSRNIFLCGYRCSNCQIVIDGKIVVMKRPKKSKNIYSKKTNQIKKKIEHELYPTSWIFFVDVFPRPFFPGRPSPFPSSGKSLKAEKVKSFHSGSELAPVCSSLFFSRRFPVFFSTYFFRFSRTFFFTLVGPTSGFPFLFWSSSAGGSSMEQIGDGCRFFARLYMVAL